MKETNCERGKPGGEKKNSTLGNHLFILPQRTHYIAKRKSRDRIIEIKTQSCRLTHKKKKKTSNEYS